MKPKEKSGFYPALPDLIIFTEIDHIWVTFGVKLRFSALFTGYEMYR